jgi:hypothetical protein
MSCSIADEMETPHWEGGLLPSWEAPAARVKDVQVSMLQIRGKNKTKPKTLGYA